MERPYFSSGKVKEKSDSINGFEEDHSSATSWPAKQCYICSFCNRKFRSAQALGGHMNVHRRDRARLLLLPSAVSGSHNPTRKINPKSNFASSPSSSSAKFSPRTHHPMNSSSFTSLSLSSLSSTSTASREEEKKLVTDLVLQLDPLSSQGKYVTSTKRIRGILEFRELKGLIGQKDSTSKLLRKEGAGSLDLEILKGSKKDLDLELRLGWF